MMKKTILLVGFAVSLVLLIGLNKDNTSPVLDSLCKGSARCFEGTVDDIIDGDTFEIDSETIRLALINTPEKWEDDYEMAIDFVWRLCPIGSFVVVDEDDMQISRSHRRTVAVVYCKYKGRYVSLNEEILKAGYAEILTDFCIKSEFATEDWARAHGCL